MTEADKAREELIEWFGPTSKYVENNAWLDSHVKGVVMWRAARKVCDVTPLGDDSIPQYWKFVNNLALVRQYKTFMELSDV